MFTPGRCKKTGSTPGATWAETSAVCGVGTSGKGTTDAPRDDSGAVVASCIGVSDDDSTLVRDDGSGTLAAAWTGVSDDDCTAIGADPAGTFAPGEAKKKYVSPAKPNVAMIAVPAISFRRDPTFRMDYLAQKAGKDPHPQLRGEWSLAQKNMPSSRRFIWGQKGGPTQRALGEAVSVGPHVGPYVGSIYGHASSPSPAVSPFAAGAPH